MAIDIVFDLDFELHQEVFQVVVEGTSVFQWHQIQGHGLQFCRLGKRKIQEMARRVQQGIQRCWRRGWHDADEGRHLPLVLVLVSGIVGDNRNMVDFG